MRGWHKRCNLPERTGSRNAVSKEPAMIVEQMIVGHMEVCCYLVGCPETRKALLIDPAGNEDQVVQKAVNLGLAVQYIVNTHGHPDHTCGNKRVKELTGALVVMHEMDDDFFQNAQSQMFYRQMGFDPAPPADIRIKDGEIITIGNISLKAIHTPGHTPGAVCLYGQENLFTGDTLFVGAVGRTDLPGGSLETLLKSIEERILPLPDATIIWPGHDYGDSPTSTLGEEKETNPYISNFVEI